MAQISQTNFRRRLALSFALPLILMSLLAALLVGQITQLISVLQWVSHTNQVIAQANLTEKLLVDMETGLRGYLVTGNSEFLEPYKQARSSIDSNFDQFSRLISDNASQQQRLNKVRSLYKQWFPYSQQMIARRAEGGDYQSSAINKQGKQIMDAIRREMASFIQTEESLRNTRTQAVQKTTWSVLVTRFVTLLLVGIILALFIRQQLIAVAKSYGRALAVAQAQTEALQESEAALRRSAQRLASLHEIDRAILLAQSLSDLVGAALSRMRQLVPCQQAFVVLFNLETGTAQVVADSSNGDENLPEGMIVPIADFTLDEKLPEKTRYVEDVEALESRPPAFNHLLLDEIRSYLTVPLKVEENLIGELDLVATQIAAFSPEHQEIAQEVAAQLAIAIQQATFREQLQRYTSELEQRVAERTQRLEESNTELEAFSYSVSHDLRAPLRTMQGFTQALIEDYGDKLNSIGQEYAHYIIDSAVQMDTLISDLLSYSRLSRTEIRMQPIDLSRAISDALSQLDAQLRERQAVVTVEKPLPQVMAHRTTLIQVLTNLLSNAIKFVEPNIQPQVRVWAEERVEEDKGTRGQGDVGNEEETGHSRLGNTRNGEKRWASRFPVPASSSTLSPEKWVRLWVEDNGIGIASEYQERIFRVFERLHGVETYPGTGIGLAIVRKGMERMGGRVGVESQIDRGTCFWIELPIAES
jgi:signal transduction histidine kinase/CHASE3 domain sensor protein